MEQRDVMRKLFNVQRSWRSFWRFWRQPRCVLPAPVLQYSHWDVRLQLPATAAALRSSFAIKRFKGSLCVRRQRRNVQVEAVLCIIFSCTATFYSKDTDSLSLALYTHTPVTHPSLAPFFSSPFFSNTQWLLWKCQRPHQRPLLLRCAVARPSTAPHYWLTAPHRLRSIKAPPAAAPCRRLPGPVWAATQTQTDRG